MDPKLKEYVNAGKRCLRAQKFENAAKLFSTVLDSNIKFNKAKIFEYRATTFFMLKVYDKTLKDAQRALLLDPKSSNAYLLISKAMWLLDNRTGAISVLKSGITSSDKADPKYNLLRSSLELFSKELNNPKKRTDPLFDVPIEISFAILSHFSIPELFMLRGVCKQWSSFISSSRQLWRNVDFSKQGTVTTIPVSLLRGTPSEPNRLSHEQPNSFFNSQSSGMHAGRCVGKSCHKLFQTDKFTNQNQKIFKKQPVPEKAVVSGIQNASTQLVSVIVPDSRNLGASFISALTKISHPRLSSICLLRLLKLNEPSKIAPLVRNFLQTNHLRSLCFSYNSSITSEIVYNIGLHCTNLTRLDISCTPGVDWGLLLTQVAKLEHKKWFSELEELYVENQVGNYTLISSHVCQLGIRFNKIKTLSLLWNINKFNLLTFGSFSPFREIEAMSYNTFEMNFGSFPALGHVCLDGLFDIYTPVFPYNLTTTQFVYSSSFVPNFCVFSCGSQSNLTSEFFLTVLQRSTRLTSLNLANAVHLHTPVISAVSQFCHHLVVLNLSGCVGLLPEDINLVVNSCGQLLEVLDLSKTAANETTQLTIAYNMSPSITKILLDQTMSTGSGLVAISKAIRNLYYICRPCSKPLSGFSDHCSCVTERNHNSLKASNQTQTRTQSQSQSQDQNQDQNRVTSQNSGTPGTKRKFSELGKGSIYANSSSWNRSRNGTENDTENLISSFARSASRMKNILISVNNCTSIRLDAVEESRNQLKGTLARVMYQFY